QYTGRVLLTTACTCVTAALEVALLCSLVGLVTLLLADPGQPGTIHIPVLHIDWAVSPDSLILVCVMAVACRTLIDLLRTYYVSSTVATFERVLRDRLCRRFFSASYERQSVERAAYFQALIIENVAIARGMLTSIAGSLSSCATLLILA